MTLRKHMTELLYCLAFDCAWLICVVDHFTSGQSSKSALYNQVPFWTPRLILKYTYLVFLCPTIQHINIICSTVVPYYFTELFQHLDFLAL